MININTIDDLRRECLGGVSEFFICLNGGLRSSKTITYDEEGWYVAHDMDWTYDEFETDAEFKENYPFLFEAMEKEAFYKR